MILVNPADGIEEVSIRFAIWTLYEAMRNNLRVPLCSRTYYIGTWGGREMVHVNALQKSSSTTVQNRTKNIQAVNTPGLISTIPGVSANSSFSFASTSLSKTNDVGDSDLHGEITYHA